MAPVQTIKYTDEMIREMKPTRVRAFAPPTIANVGPGYDMFGVCLKTDGVEGDTVTAERVDGEYGVTLTTIENDPGLTHPNVVVVVANEILHASGLNCGVRLQLTKGMRKGTGKGSSAASAVASALATNAVLGSPFDRNDPIMINAVVKGEAAAIRKLRGHADNVLPCLLGGFVFIYDQKDFNYVRLEVPGSIGFVLASPYYELSTAEMRDALKNAPYDIDKLIAVAAKIIKAYHDKPNLESTRVGINSALGLWGIFDGNGNIEKDGGFRDVVVNYLMGSVGVYRGLTEGNSFLLGTSVMSDDIVTAVRLPFIPGGEHMFRAAGAVGAYGSCISGSGPSMFSVFEWRGISEGHAYDSRVQIGNAMQQVFLDQDLKSDILVAQVCNEGACVIFAE